MQGVGRAIELNDVLLLRWQGWRIRLSTAEVGHGLPLCPRAGPRPHTFGTNSVDMLGAMGGDAAQGRGVALEVVLCADAAHVGRDGGLGRRRRG